MTSPLQDPDARTIPTDRESLRALVTALLGEPDIFGILARGFVEIVGTDGPLVSLLHQASDVDGSPFAQHHTLGAGARQAAAGNHDHLIPKLWRKRSDSALATIVLADAEKKDTGLGDLTITARANREYLIGYTAQVGASGADVNFDLRVRYRVGTATTAPGAVVNTDPQAAASSMPGRPGLPRSVVVLDVLGGSFLTGGEPSLPVNLAAFYDVTTGAGTGSVAQSAGARRLLFCMEAAVPA